MDSSVAKPWRLLRRRITAIPATVWLCFCAAQCAYSQVSSNEYDSVLGAPEGPRRWFGDIGFVPPKGWSLSAAPDGSMVVMRAPTAPQSPSCAVLLTRPVASDGRHLAVQAEAFVNAAVPVSTREKRFEAYRGRAGQDVKLSRYEGISGAGWTYVDLLGNKGSVFDHNFTTIRAMVAQLRSGIVYMVGIAGQGASCMTNQDYRDDYVWSLLFHGLNLPGYAGESPQLKEQLIGRWSRFGGRILLSDEYAPNGRFSNSGVHGSYYRDSVNSSRIRPEVDAQWEGDGSYFVRGDRLTTTSSVGEDAGKAVTHLFSIVRTPAPDRPSGWGYILRVVTEHGQIYTRNKEQ